VSFVVGSESAWISAAGAGIESPSRERSGRAEGNTLILHCKIQGKSKMKLPVICKHCNAELKASFSYRGVEVEVCECKGEEQELDVPAEDEYGLGPDADEIRSIKAQNRPGGWRI
jgi:hypothetical protein